MSAAIRRRLGDARDDRGSVLVAAVAVALVGAMLAVLVVATVISAARSSGKDRARSTEVHSAEGVVDTVYELLETTTPCRWPATGSAVTGTSPSVVRGSADVAYFDKDGHALTCAGGAVTGGVPATAVVTATATAGDGSTRTMQSKVALTPTVVNGRGAAIFAANSILTTNSFTVTTALPDTQVDVWVDSGDVDCNSNVTVNGNMIVANGGVRMANACRITGNLWSKKNVEISQAHSGGLQSVGGSLFATADARMNSGVKIGGDIVLTGSLTQWGPIQVGGAIRTGVAGSQIPQYVSKRLPEVTYRPDDWTGFVISGDRQAAYRSWVRSNAAANGAQSWAASMNASGTQCSVAGASYDLNGPLVGPTVPTLFDTRNCSQTRFENGLNIKLRSDLVLFVNSFYSTGNFRVTSADGNQHNFWIIVADKNPNGVAECSGGIGDIKGDSGSLAVSPITVFMYTPCTIDTNNDTQLSGQLYGGTVNLRNPVTINYVPIGIPGVELPSTEPEGDAGYRVDVVYKREIGTP
ncbi:hypothetical protein [Cellulomonas palmilytica]|uniref:hypothetical protein n=1 Tax=Cellulomonas palmilytica TaxID=2608402 RepID=UPI001F2EB73A|nr:hypothetical protein [Cellulomonas palmilytica]UJP38935.1 hypothetical protein F1D97_11180 [Cellulomonas palmilytica]